MCRISYMESSLHRSTRRPGSEAFDIQRVRRALHLLTADHQEVLHLRFGQRQSLQETADLMGKSVSAIKSLQFRAVETLRGLLSDPKPETTHG